MKFGLTDEHYSFINSELKKLKDQGAEIWCFGSRARGDYQKFSDLDLMVESEGDYSKELRDLRDVFEDSRLPIKVDIVQFKDFADSYKDGYLADRVRF